MSLFWSSVVNVATVIESGSVPAVAVTGLGLTLSPAAAPAKLQLSVPPAEQPVKPSERGESYKAGLS